MPHPLVSMALVIILIVGTLIALSFFSMEEGTGEYRQKGILVVIITSILTILLGFAATAKLWFPHLWKKNSTHARHKQHTRYHPAMREREFRKSR